MSVLNPLSFLKETSITAIILNLVIIRLFCLFFDKRGSIVEKNIKFNRFKYKSKNKYDSRLFKINRKFL